MYLDLTLETQLADTISPISESNMLGRQEILLYSPSYAQFVF